MEIESSNPRAVIMELVKEKFKHLLAWDRMEAPIALLCSEIPEATNEKQKEELIKSLKKIKNYLKEQGINLKELTFLDEEIERYAHTKQISLYKEKDDVVPTEIIEKYSRLSYGNEGIVGIHLNYNYEQLRKLTNGVYRKTKEIIFYISREKTIYGKIVAEIFEHPQQIPIATLLVSCPVF